MISAALTLLGVAAVAYLLIRLDVLTISLEKDGKSLFHSDRLK